MPPRRPPRPRRAGPLLGLLCAVALTACAGRPAPGPGPAVPTVSRTPTPLPFGILPLGGVAAEPLRLAGPFVADGRLAAAPAEVAVSRVPFNPSTAVADFARGLGLVGPPMAIGGGLAYNLGAGTGFQLTTAAGLLTFALHPNHPVEEIGATPTVAEADRVARAFVARHHLLAGGGLTLLPALTRVNGSDRRITYDLTLMGLPVVDITGAPARIEVDVATDGYGRMAVVGAGGRLPYPAVGAQARYRTVSPTEVVTALDRRRVDPGRYRLAPDLRPYPPARPAPRPAAPARLVGDQLAVVVDAGFAVPVYVFRVAGRPRIHRFVTCALPTTSCLPLRYAAPASPRPSRG